MAVPQWAFRQWYLRARRTHKQLPPWSCVRVRYGRLENMLATVSLNIDTKSGAVRHAAILIDRSFRRLNQKLTFREFAHEVAHVAYPTVDHGVSFSRKVVEIASAMEKDPAWY